MARRKTATQIAASKRNLIKARQARSAKAKYGDLPAGTYLIGAKAKVRRNFGAQGTISKAVIPQSSMGKVIRKQLPVKSVPAIKAIAGPTIKFHPYTGKPYDTRKTGGKELPLIGRAGADYALTHGGKMPPKPKGRKATRRRSK